MQSQPVWVRLLPPESLSRQDRGCIIDQLDDIVICVSLPSLVGSPPERCIVCSAARVPPESDDGIPPPYHWDYVCNGGYFAEDEIALADWSPRGCCFAITTEQALANLRDTEEFRELQPNLAQITAQPLDQGCTLCVSLPRIQGPSTPSMCPICRVAPTTKHPNGEKQYECGAYYSLSSTRPGPYGKPEPTSFVGCYPCTRPPLKAILRCLWLRDDHYKALCENALARA